MNGEIILGLLLGLILGTNLIRWLSQSDFQKEMKRKMDERIESYVKIKNDLETMRVKFTDLDYRKEELKKIRNEVEEREKTRNADNAERMADIHEHYNTLLEEMRIHRKKIKWLLNNMIKRHEIVFKPQVNQNFLKVVADQLKEF